MDIRIQNSETRNTLTPKSSKKRKFKQSNKDDVKQSDVKVISEGIKLISNSLNNEYDITLKKVEMEVKIHEHLQNMFS